MREFLANFDEMSKLIFANTISEFIVHINFFIVQIFKYRIYKQFKFPVEFFIFMDTFFWWLEPRKDNRQIHIVCLWMIYQ